jgi:pimeloyl-ACP methyl ester carboxylesterase
VQIEGDNIMIPRTVSLAVTAAGILLAASSPVIAQGSPAAPLKTGYAPVDGLKLYYELYGTGEPLVLLHGGVGATEMFADILPLLASSRRVIAVDLQAHGRTADIDRPISYEAMADDIAGLIKYLGFQKADVMGYSLGGGVALRTAIQHPEVVRKLVLVSTPFRRDGWYPEILAGMAQMGPGAAEPMKQTPMYQLYARIAPKPADWPVLLTKLGDLLRKDYDWSKDVAAIKAPTLLVVGDADAVRTSHAVQFFELLGGGRKDGGWDGSGISNARLAILPGVTHYTIFSSPAMAATATAFLDAAVPAAR